MDLSSTYVWACLVVTMGFGAIGFLDDYDKVTKASHKGLSGRFRLAAEFLIAGIAAMLIVQHNGTALYVPFWNGPAIDLGLFYYVFAAFVIVSFGNAVNLTDGLDGLATMPVVIACMAFTAITLSRGARGFRGLSRHPPCAGCGRPCDPHCARSSARGWRSCGITRHLPRCSWATPAASRWAARIGVIAVVSHHEIVLGIIGGLFVVEALSVIIQVFFLQAHRQACVQDGADPPSF
jgi:phospho-N-acetylmuramoyl-pentapeptide-transferase